MDLFTLLLDIMDMGGPVMVPIAVLSSWMWILILLKADWLHRAGKYSLTSSEAIERIRSGDCGRLPAGCPRAGVLRFFLDHHFTRRQGRAEAYDEIFFEVAVRRQVRTLYRYLPTIMILAAAAPLLGLLGTVTGMVETFRAIGFHGMGNAQAMASGIREALITTQAGLLVAIPGLLAGQAMGKKVKTIHHDMRVFHMVLGQWLEKESRQCGD
jgi:biopolymer transport protein ExbB